MVSRRFSFALIYGSFPLPDSDSDLDSESGFLTLRLHSYYAQHVSTDFTQMGTVSHSQGWVSVPILGTDLCPYYIHFNLDSEPLIEMYVIGLKSEPVEKSCIVQVSVSESKSKS